MMVNKANLDHKGVQVNRAMLARLVGPVLMERKGRRGLPVWMGLMEFQERMARLELPERLEILVQRESQAVTEIQVVTGQLVAPEYLVPMVLPVPQDCQEQMDLLGASALLASQDREEIQEVLVLMALQVHLEWMVSREREDRKVLQDLLEHEVSKEYPEPTELKEILGALEIRVRQALMERLAQLPVKETQGIQGLPEQTEIEASQEQKEIQEFLEAWEKKAIQELPEIQDRLEQLDRRVKQVEEVNEDLRGRLEQMEHQGQMARQAVREILDLPDHKD